MLTLSGLIDERMLGTADATKFNASMIWSKQEFFDGPAMGQFDGTNQTGIYRIRFQKKVNYMVIDPFDQAVEWQCPNHGCESDTSIFHNKKFRDITFLCDDVQG